MTGRALRTRRVGLIGALVAAAAAAHPAFAQSAGSGTGMNGGITGAGSGSDYTAPGDVIDQGKGTTGKGVAGTGMGKMPSAGNAMGTGNSVKGAPGQGIDGPISNSTDTAK